MPKLHSWDKPTPDGQQTLVVSNTTSIVKFQHSSSQWLSHHHLVSYAKWQTEHSGLIRPSPNNFKKDTRAGSTPSEESPSNKDHISSSETPSHTTPNTFSVHSQLSTHSTGSRTRPQFSTESQTLLNGQQFGSAPVFQHISPVLSLTHSTTQLEKWWICGQRKTELMYSKETIEKPQHGCGSQPQPGTFHSQDSWNFSSGRHSHCKKFK